MKVLISPVSIEEARTVIDSDADIVDVKNTLEGSLGASFPWVIQQVAAAARPSGKVVSATLGDLPFKPGTASLAALGAACAGARYVKAGLFGAADVRQATEMMQAVVRACQDFDPAIVTVAAGYADYRRFNGLNPRSLLSAASAAGCAVVMVDTAVKDGKGLFDAMSPGEVGEFVEGGHRLGLEVALAGSLKVQDVYRLAALGADIVGVRGCVCSGSDRSTRIDAQRVHEFLKLVRSLPATATAMVS